MNILALVRVFSAASVLLVGMPSMQGQGSVLTNSPVMESIDAHAGAVLFNEFSMLGGEQAVYSFQGRQRQGLHKAILSPLRLFGLTDKAMDLRVNLAQQGQFSTLGLGLQADISGSLISDSRTYIHLGGNMKLFPDWGSPERDTDGDGLADNRYSVSVIDLQAGIVRAVRNKLGFHLTGHYQAIREKSTEATPEVVAAGYSVGLVKDGVKIQSEAVKNMNFRYGLSIEQLFAIENGGALNIGQKYSLAYGPYIGIRADRFLDLRISLPVVNREGRQDERGFGPFFVLSFWI